MSNIDWLSESNMDTTDDNRLDFNFSGVTDLGALAGIYSAKRHRGQTTQEFEIVLCHFEVPANIFTRIDQADDIGYFESTLE